MNSEY